GAEGPSLNRRDRAKPRVGQRSDRIGVRHNVEQVLRRSAERQVVAMTGVAATHTAESAATAAAATTAAVATAARTAAARTTAAGAATMIVVSAIVSRSGCSLQHRAKAEGAAEPEVEAEVGWTSAVVDRDFCIAAALRRRGEGARHRAVGRCTGRKRRTIVELRIAVDVGSRSDVVRLPGANDQVWAGGNLEGRAPGATEDGIAAGVECSAAIVNLGIGVAGGNAIGVAVGETQGVEAEDLQRPRADVGIHAELLLVVHTTGTQVILVDTGGLEDEGKELMVSASGEIVDRNCTETADLLIDTDGALQSVGTAQVWRQNVLRGARWRGAATSAALRYRRWAASCTRVQEGVLLLRRTRNAKLLKAQEIRQAKAVIEHAEPTAQDRRWRFAAATRYTVSEGETWCEVMRAADLVLGF